MTHSQAADIYLQTLLKAWDLQENLDLLKGTTAYRHDLRQNANKLAGSLEKLLSKDMNEICGIEDDVLYKQMDYYKELINKISTLRADENGIVALIIEMYKENPDKVLEALKIQIVDK
jgi:hypothetical protein